ncbi:IclR family transcriptional regulator [Nonomuraea sp. K274]|uniref:IclR family transcriptional regulator n=1 Tax=Nonomuraea cypriaca TaxID=1187855 RepID=A0A931EXV2_9ACTN|nr:IclR family transcriptional regulator [Nonomuraea cypriaca]MBF8184581.1 IclR family transcriptional regulator [Nonomuraea cypriaca]
MSDTLSDGSAEKPVTRPRERATQPGRYSTAGKVLKLLEALAARERVGVRELARDIGIDKSAVSRLFDQFCDLGLAEQDQVSGQFSAGPGLFSLAAMIHGRDTLWQATEPILRKLATHFNETCYLATREGDQIVFREKIDCTHTLRYVIDPGSRVPLHAGAGGRAVLLGLPPEEVDQIIERTGLPQITPQTIIDPDELRRQLREDRSRGYAISMGERVAAGSAVAAPFYDADGRCRGSLVFTCPSQRFDIRRAPEIADSVTAASRALSQRLGHQLAGTAAS